VGHIEILERAGAEEVLTLPEAAALLRLSAEAVRASALAGELPGRAFGEEWRFARTALLAWLAGDEGGQRGGGAGAKSADE
jgi:excisionase family DNA binding protein